MAGVPNYGKRRGWMPVVAGLMAGVGLAAIVFSLVLSAKVPDMVENRVYEVLGMEGGSWRLPDGQKAAQETGSGIDSERRNAVVEATEKVSPAVVTITVSTVQRVAERGPIYEWFGRFYQSPPRIQEVPVSAMGSGVIISPFGRIVTNHHVVASGGNINVTLADGRQFPARLLASSAKYDLAVLEVDLDGERLPYAELGDSDDLFIGEWAIAIGSPFGFYLNDPRPTVTVGVISALNRDVKGSDDGGLFSDMIQTDAAINPGNSGGPLLNSRGQVIGINTFIFTKGGGSEGIGFARPINTVTWVLNELTKHGEVRDPWVGIDAAPVLPQYAEQMNLSVNHGLFVTRVFNDTPAAEAGIIPGDVIIAIAGLEIRSQEAARRILYRFEVGDYVDMTINRDGDEIALRVHLIAQEEN